MSNDIGAVILLMLALGLVALIVLVGDWALNQRDNDE